jgi:manganese-dependent inorganic pyrophosphatase
MDSYGIEMLRAASSIKGMSTTELIKSDFKSFVVNDKSIGIGQVMTMDFDTIKENIDDFITKLNEMTETNYSNVVLFITDIIKNGSYVLYNDASSKLVADAFGLTNIYQGIFLPKIVSRKKQMLPNIMNVLDGES